MDADTYIAIVSGVGALLAVGIIVDYAFDWVVRLYRRGVSRGG